MSDFEFIFALFGLLLGLSLTEVLAGFARAIDRRVQRDAGAALGLLTPLLGAFVMLDLLSFWHAAWVSRDLVAVSGPSLLAITVFTGAYYLAARLVFPRGADDRPDYDAHFFRVRRIVVGVMLALLLCQLAWYLSVPALAARLSEPVPLAMTGVLVALMLAAAVVRDRRRATLVMAALVGRYLVAYLLTYLR